MTDTDGDGIADRREVWFNPGTLTGCANDLHGPFLGRDGWIYWSKGAFAEQQLDLVGGGKLVTKAAHIFRRLPSGGGVEAVMTGGMDNPVEFVMTLGGDRFFTSTFMLHPGGGKRDGIGHASYGAMFGKDHDVLNDHPRTLASLNQPITHLGPAAPAGLCVTDSGLWGAEYRGNLFAALFNLHKVTRHVLSSEGSAFRATDQDFLTSDNRDFHPTDVFEDADGSLIVIDTGGWYKICCPTSQLYKPDVLGAIYRIRKTDSPKRDDPRGLRIDWKTAGAGDLARLLEDDRAKVQQRAVRELAGRGASAVPSIAGILRRSASPTARALGVWALSRINEASARSFTAVALLDVRLPDGTGIEVCRDLRSAMPELKCLMLTSYNDDEATYEDLTTVGLRDVALCKIPRRYHAMDFNVGVYSAEMRLQGTVSTCAPPKTPDWVHGKVVDPRLRTVAATAPAFPPDFTTRVSLSERCLGFVQRYENKVLQVIIVKQSAAARLPAHADAA